jgi:type II secretory pathway pseudopilin PulG
MKGQVSTELLVIVGLILLIFIPLLVLVYVKANDANQQIASYQAELTVTRIASLANSVGSLGTETSVETDVYLPPNTISLETVASGRGGEIVLTVKGTDGDSPIADVIKYPLSNPGVLADSSAAGGRMKIRISSEYVGDQAMIKIERA